MLLQQFSLRKLLVAVMLVALYFPCDQVYRYWLASTYGYSYVEAVIALELHNGDTIKQVGRQFHQMRLLTPASDSEYLTNLAMVWSNRGLPIQENDEFFHASLRGGAGAYLQFRDGRLVNLWNTAYIDSHKLAPSPPPDNLARLRFIAIYLAGAVLVLLADSVLAFLLRRNKRSRTKPSNASLLDGTLHWPVQ